MKKARRVGSDESLKTEENKTTEKLMNEYKKNLKKP